MDRDLQSRELRGRRLRRWAGPLLALALLALLVVLVPGWLRPTLNAHELRIDAVRVDEIAATLATDGRVLPQHEQIVSSPIDARVLRILLRPGAAVQAGQAILELDTERARGELAGLERQIALQENAIDKATLLLEQTLVDLKAQIQIKELEQKSHEYELERNRTLVEKGLITGDTLRSSQTDLERTTIELEQLRRSTSNEERKLQVDLEGLQIEIAILRDRRDETQQAIDRASASASRPGVVTAVAVTEGQALRQGDELARVADLGSFRVEASFADAHAQRLALGLAAQIRAGETTLGGRIGRILPAVENGAVRVEIELDEPSHAALRQNLRVEVEVLVERHPQALVVRRGAIVHRDGARYLFVLEGERALRREVRIGLSNLETHEIVEGLAAGERVILDDMSDYARYEEVAVR